MRYELHREDIPTKFHVFTERNGRIYWKNGIIDPRGVEMYLNVDNEIVGSLEEKIAHLEAMGYKKVED